MNQSICDKLEHLTGRLDELDRMLASGDATRDMDEYRRLSREHAEIAPVVALYQIWSRTRSDLAAALEMVGDPEMRELAEAEVAASKERLPQIDIGAMEKHPEPLYTMLELQIYNIRHLMQHVGEMGERLGSRLGTEIDWVGKSGE